MASSWQTAFDFLHSGIIQQKALEFNSGCDKLRRLCGKGSLGSGTERHENK